MLSHFNQDLPDGDRIEAHEKRRGGGHEQPSTTHFTRKQRKQNPLHPHSFLDILLYNYLAFKVKHSIPLTPLSSFKFLGSIITPQHIHNYPQKDSFLHICSSSSIPSILLEIILKSDRSPV